MWNFGRKLWWCCRASRRRRWWPRGCRATAWRCWRGGYLPLPVEWRRNAETGAATILHRGLGRSRRRRRARVGTGHGSLSARDGRADGVSELPGICDWRWRTEPGSRRGWFTSWRRCRFLFRFRTSFARRRRRWRRTSATAPAVAGILWTDRGGLQGGRR